jgi:hypothetical protein
MLDHIEKLHHAPLYNGAWWIHASQSHFRCVTTATSTKEAAESARAVMSAGGADVKPTLKNKAKSRKIAPLNTRSHHGWFTCVLFLVLDALLRQLVELLLGFCASQ